MSEPNILAAALSALESGLCPIRAKTDGSKAPLGQWKQWQYARPDEVEVRGWFSDWPNIGVVTGAISDRLVCLEFEGRAMELLPRVRELLAWAGLWKVFESWVNGYSERTPSGGLHILVHLGGDATLAGNTKIASNESGETLIETRGEGGFVITAPSNGDTHPSGGSWSMNAGGFDTIAWVTPEEWQGVCEALATFDASPPVPVVTAKPRLEGVLAETGGWIDRALTKLPSMSQVLEANGWECISRDDKYWYWSRPGKMPRGNSATVNANDRLFVHSTNAHPIPASPDRRTFDVVDVLCCYENGHLPSNDERVSMLAYYADRRPASPTPAPRRQEAGVELADAACHLPDDFWSARPVLDQINVAARSRLVSPDATLAAVLARVAACTPHNVCLPPLIGGSVPLSYMSLLVGPPEVGKSAASRVATALVPPIDAMADGLPVGTGEGIIDALFAMVAEPDPVTGKTIKVRRQVLHNAYVYVDEGATLITTGAKAGSIILPTLRTIFTGGILGNTLADLEKRRIVPAGGAAYGVVVAVQPEVAAGLLTMGEILAGTPQRFTFTSALDPKAPLEPPTWPGELAWAPPHPTYGEMEVTDAIAKEVHAYHYGTQRGVQRDRLDAHLLLRKEKVAALLAILEGRLNITTEDWQLAGALMLTSNAVRTVVQARIHENTEAADEAADSRVARRQVRVAEAVASTEIELAVGVVMKMIARHPDGVKRGDLYRSASPRTRDNLDAALALAVDRNLVEVVVTPGQGGQKRTFRLRT
jgi:hypothetical protein